MPASESTGRTSAASCPDTLGVIRDLLLQRRSLPPISPARAQEIGRELVPGHHALHARVGLMMLAEPGPALVAAVGDRERALALAEAAGGIERASRYLIALADVLGVASERVALALTARADAVEVAQEAQQQLDRDALEATNAELEAIGDRALSAWRYGRTEGGKGVRHD